MSTRDRILDAAEQVIREYGIAGATTKRIAQRADCSEALLYKHFASKERLVLAVLLERLPAMGPALHRLRSWAGEGDLAAHLAEFAVAAVTFYTEAAAIASGAIGDPELIVGFREMLAKAGTGPHLPILALADILREEQRLGRLDAALDPAAAADLLMGACFHRANLSYFVTLPKDTAAWAAGVVSTLIRR
ncbi:MAG: helix-turn-helix transcriptional regulator [Nonomuraea sp.]|nr:helix-turn-helix transcriptional regulator [Nonomuraea sp.]